jgi:pseudouridine synthase
VLLALNKPYGVLSQFTPEPGSRWRTLAEFSLPKDVYALGRLDADSEGLLLLSDEAGLNSQLLEPRRAHRREYWVQVERIPEPAALAQLEEGVMLDDRRTLPCVVRRLEPAPILPPRDPPIRARKNVPDCWAIRPCASCAPGSADSGLRTLRSRRASGASSVPRNARWSSPDESTACCAGAVRPAQEVLKVNRWPCSVPTASRLSSARQANFVAAPGIVTSANMGFLRVGAQSVKTPDWSPVASRLCACW